MPTEYHLYQRNALYRQAREFLRDLLAAGPLPYRTVLVRATEAEISRASLLAAKCWLHIDSQKVDKSTIWSLPPDASLLPGLQAGCPDMPLPKLP
jgi:hypothetical protein